MKIKMSRGIGEPFRTINVPDGSTAEQIYNKYKDSIDYGIYAAMIDNKVKPLTRKVKEGSEVRFLDIRSKQAYLIYQHSLVLMMLKAAKDVIGKAHFEVKMMINEGLYIEPKTKADIDEDAIAKIYIRMKELVDADLPIEEKSMSRRKSQDLLADEGLTDDSKLRHFFGENETVRLCTIDDYSDFFCYYMVPSTGYLTNFELMRYRDGMLLRFAQPDNPNDIPNFVDEYIVYRAFAEQNEWNELLGVKYVADLNEKIKSGNYRNIIQLSEALHDKKIVTIANEITEKKKRMILILGPSSSGKTTFAHRLLIQLMVNGLKPLYIGTDDYFVEREETPKDENGEYNFEGIDALDVKLFNEQMSALLAGKEVDMPVFDFIEGHKVFGKKITKIEENCPIIIEGIHAFNPALTEQIADEEKFKIYLSPLTQINLNAHNRIPTTDTRLIRRIVRDNRSRGNGAATTISRWNKIHSEENKNIFPYTSQADVFFNSVLTYEIAVMKRYAAPLLREIGSDEPEYSEAQRLLGLYNFVEEIEDDEAITTNSILREFIGDSIFDGE